ncbi:MAG: glycine--tRNA ligase subunit beta [Tissierellia bacterium]|nr:glycine--tRNA ligase subunit beta [Tissierellia bacterium]
MNRYLLEIGVEEFPAKHIKSTQEQLRTGFENLLKDNKYTFEKISINSTPRRFALLIEGIESKQTENSEKVKGPAKKIALDSDGNPTKALQGFMRSKGIEFEDIYFQELNGLEYVYADIKHEIEALDSVLKRGVPEIIRSISNPRAMRWGGKNLRFLRPIRWIVSLLDDQVLDFDLEGIKVGNETKGHRTLGKNKIVIDKIDNYESLLEENFVIVDEEKRRNIITKGLNKLSKGKGGNYISDDDLLDEVVNINEYPTPFIGNFDTEYLKLPKEVIVTPMKDHQRYFPVEDDQKILLPYFISVRNGDQKGIENVSKGNEKVLVARLEDAKFFYDLDVQVPFQAYVGQLESLGYHDGLGNMAQKSKRLAKLVKSIGSELDISTEVIENAQRAAHLSKADLVTKLVIEFTELQGTMGRIYAQNSGENKIVSQAIEEQYMPRFSGDDLPESTVGILLSLADKIDTIAGLHTLGIQVTGSQDPYGQRRAALGVLNILLENKMKLDLRKVFQDALYNFVEDFGQNFEYDLVTNNILDFIGARLRNKLLEDGHRYDLVDAVINQDKLDVYEIYEKLISLEKFLDQEGAEDAITRFVRMKNISKTYAGQEIDQSILEENDKKIFELLEDLHEVDFSQHDYLEVLEEMEEISKSVDQYLDKTMINVENEPLKASRIALVKEFSKRVENIFDPSIIVRN